MSQNSTPWDSEPKFHDSVSERDGEILRSIAKAMLRALYPASTTWKVKYQAQAHVVGVKVPKDVKVTLEHMRAPGRVSPGRVSRVWCEWSSTHDSLFLCAAVRKDVAPTAGVKRARVEDDGESS